MGAWAKCRVYIEYDSSGVWEQKTEIKPKNGIQTYIIPIMPRRCDHMRLRLEGHGEMQLYSIARVLEIGGAS